MNQPLSDNPTSLRVLVVGPMAPAVGGMATLIERLLAGPLSRTVTFVRHPANGAGIEHRSLLRSLLRHLRRITELGRSVVGGRIDLVHVYTCSGFTFYRNAIDAWVARRCGAAVILHICGGRFGEFCAQAAFPGRWLIRWTLSRADRVVVLSEGWRQRLTPYAGQARLAVVPNGVPIPTAVHDDARPPGLCRFLFVGTVGRTKGTDTLLAAAAGLRDRGVAFELTLIGPVEQAADNRSLDDQIRGLSLGDCVEHLGTVTDEVKDELLERCDCLVLPSRAEGLPLVLLEAGARGRAVVATAVGAVPEVIDDPAFGLIVPPDDPQRLAEAMQTVANDPAARRAMGSALRRRIMDGYSSQRQFQLIGDIYQQIAAARSETTAPCPALAGGESG